jgi:uracil-DNA glycosylase family 4
MLDDKFDQLCDAVANCENCPRMHGSLRVLNRSAGHLKASLMFVGEAPGRLGADSSGIPFHGDKAGHNFESFLSFAGIDRSNVFVTNAVLCNPKDEKGNNSTPNKIEIGNCASFLRKQIDLVNPRIVATLGGTALLATSLIENHNLSLKEDVRSRHSWYGRSLIPLYHPGQRALLHRSFLNQRADYQFVADELKKQGKNQHKIYGKPANDVADVIDLITTLKPSLSYFALHKLFYLVEYTFAKRFNEKATTGYIVRQKDGPYCTDLHLSKLKKSFSDLTISNSAGIIMLMRQKAAPNRPEAISDNIRKVVEEVVAKFGEQDEVSLKRLVYLTQPMRKILRKEKIEHRNLMNVPLNFSIASST